MRAFIALLPPLDVVEHLEDFVAPRRGTDPGLRWSDTEQFHVTLAFLPELAEVDIDELSERLAALSADRASFEVSLSGGGAFPDVAAAKVLWVGLAEIGARALADDPHNEPADDGDRADDGEHAFHNAADSRLTRLARNCRNAAAVSGTRVDGTRFTPHVTVARYGRATDATRWLRVFDAYSGPTWEAGEIALVESRLGQGRGGKPAYEIIDSFQLQRAGRGGGRLA